MAHGLVDVLEGHTASGSSSLKHIRDENVELLLLVSDLNSVATATRMGDKSFRLKFCEAVLKHLTWRMTFLFTELQLITRFL